MSDDLTNILPPEPSTRELLVNLTRLVEGLDERLVALEDKVERRLHDTRPILQAIQADVRDLRHITSASERKGS